MLFNLANILVFLGLAMGFLVMTLTIGRILRPNTPQENADKLKIYECGELPITQAWFNFNPRFYIIALIFIIFDVEIAFIYPVATVYRRWVDAGWGFFALGEIGVFVGILVLGLVYVWKKGDLEWIRVIKKQPEAPRTEPVAGPAPAALRPEPAGGE
jgi:NADH-quinone oxidoreductase subunit A